MNTTEAEKIIASKITELQSSSDRKLRIKAGQLAGDLCAWRRGHVGDCLIVSIAAAVAK